MIIVSFNIEKSVSFLGVSFEFSMYVFHHRTPYSSMVSSISYQIYMISILLTKPYSQFQKEMGQFLNVHATKRKTFSVLFIFIGFIDKLMSVLMYHSVEY